jgi:diguanylate cyclase (GGDEF)-like protein
VQQADLLIAIQAGQAGFSLLLALLLLIFLVEFRHHFLRHWALSCVALALYYAASTTLLTLIAPNGLTSTTMLMLSAVVPVLACLHVIWLILGAWEATFLRTISGSSSFSLLLLGLVLGSLGAALFSFGADDGLMRQTMGFSPLHALMGLAFVATAIMLWRALRGLRLISSRLAPAAFLLNGGFLLFVSFYSQWHQATGLFLSESVVLNLSSFMLQVLIGYSIIIWLLEIERRRSSKARSLAESAEQRLVHFRMHDPVTGLPNRRQLQDQLSAEVRAASAKRNRVAVLAIGIHRFKLLSQALGWHKTDELLRKLAHRLNELAPAGTIVGRIGERDFLLILPNTGLRDRAIEHARRILLAGARPIKQDEQELFLALSGGLCFAPDDEIDAVALINIAQQAQMRAVSAGEPLVLHRSEGSSAEPHDLLKLERELRQGVREGQFGLYFQPLISIRQRRISGFETLLRWQHPERGTLTPGSFLQEAVRLGVLDELEDQIFEQALNQLHEWQNDLSLPPISVSINLSAQRFQQPDLAGKLAKLCRQKKIDPSDLHLEITESTAMQDFEAGLSTIAQLRELGCKVCLDDFGTGYSSLAHLRRLQVDYVKLDRSFIANLERDPHERDLTRAIVDLIHSLGMTVLAEGVETRQQLGYLIHCRVDVIQGFLLGKPQPPETWRGALDQPQLVFD